jgi:hypothetical protein
MKKRMEIGKLPRFGASPDGIAAAPAFARFVIAHGGEYVVVDVAGFLDWRGVASGVLFGEFGYGAIEGTSLSGVRSVADFGRESSTQRHFAVRQNPVRLYVAAHSRKRITTSKPVKDCCAVGVNTANLFPYSASLPCE